MTSVVCGNRRTPSILPRCCPTAATGTAGWSGLRIGVRGSLMRDLTRLRHRNAGGHVSSAQRTPDEISAEIAETRNRLAGTIDELVYRVQPRTIAERQARAVVASFYNADGTLNTAKIAKIAGGVVGFVALIIAIRKIVR